MYKIFVNEKALSFSNEKIENTKNLVYESDVTFDVAFDLLFNTQSLAVNIYYFDVSVLWNNFLQSIDNVLAAGGIVQNSNGEYLFIKRRGKWDLPKGHVEKGESFDQTALREVEEECAVENLKIVNFVDTTYHVYFDKHFCLKITHWYLMNLEKDQNPKPQTEEFIEEVRWVDKKEIPLLMENTFINIKKLVEKHILNL